MNNTHIGALGPGYVVNNGTLNDNTNRDPFNTSQPCNDPCNDKPFQVNVQSSNKPQNSLFKVVQVVKTCQQAVGNLNEFMVTKFRTLFTNKCINLMVTVMPLVREFYQVCQVFADNIKLRYGYELEPQTLIPEEVEIWAKQFNVLIAEATVDINHIHPTKMDSWGATHQPAGLFPPQQAQAQSQAGYFSQQPEMATDNHAKKCAPGIHPLVGQVGASRYHTGHTLDPATEEINHLQNVATEWEQQHAGKKQNGKYSHYLEANPKSRRQQEEQCEYPDNSNRSISIISAGLEKLANINEKLVDKFQCLSRNPLQQAALHAINSSDGSNKAETTSWLEQIEYWQKEAKNPWWKYRWVPLKPYSG